MKKPFFVFVIFLLQWSCGKSQKSFLWQIEGKGVPVSYLLGTNHILSAAIVDTFPVIREKILISDVMVREANTADTSALKAFYEGLSVNPELDEMLSREEKAYLRQKSNYGIDPLKFSVMELYSFLQGIVIPAKKLTQLDSNYYSIETYLVSKAKSEGKDLIYLETLEAQLHPTHYYKPNFVTQKLMKNSIPGLLKKLKDSTSAKINPDSDGDKTMAEFTNTDFNYYLDKKCRGKFQEMFLVNRNNAWMVKLPEILKSRAFISVGQEHLKYRCGLISRLRKLGFKVTPIDMKTGEILAGN